MKMVALSWSFSAALILRVVSQYCLGILWDWHIFTWFYIWGNYNNSAIAGENWFWVLEFTPAFIGSGILVGLNTAISFVVGEILGYGIIGPALVHNRVAFGLPFFEEGDDGYEKWGAWMNFASMTGTAATPDTPSPRFWLLWPGVLLMICVSFAELALQYKVSAARSRDARHHQADDDRRSSFTWQGPYGGDAAPASTLAWSSLERRAAPSSRDRAISSKTLLSRIPRKRVSWSSGGCGCRCSSSSLSWDVLSWVSQSRRIPARKRLVWLAQPPSAPAAAGLYARIACAVACGGQLVLSSDYAASPRCED